MALEYTECIDWSVLEELVELGRVFGVEDERLGEEVGAAVVLAEGVEIDVEELRAHCAKLLANFKIPRYIWLRTEKLPRNASGKFLKRELRETLDTADAA